MMKKKYKRILWGYLILSVVITTMAEVDYNLLKIGRTPFFARFGYGYADGGTYEYLGFGYTLRDYHRFSSSRQIPWYQCDPWAYDVGPELSYFCPYLSPLWQNKDEVKLQINIEGMNEELRFMIDKGHINKYIQPEHGAYGEDAEE